MKKSTSSVILTCFGAVGVIATTILAVKATPKAMKLIEEEKRNRSEEDQDETPMRPLDYVKVAWKPYIPTLAVGASTIACIFGANVLNRKTQASLMSAYALLNSSYKEYKGKVKELYGDDADRAVKSEIAKDNYEEIKEPLDEDEQLFLDFNSLRYFRAKMEDVVQKVTTDDGLECYIIATPFESVDDFQY